jgi:protein phosphatase
VTAEGIEQLTDDHSVVGEMLRSGLITAEEAAAHPKRHAITRALGFFDDLEVDVGERPVRPGDVVVLCTDGLHDLVGPEQMCAAFAESRDPSSACDDLVSLARSRGGHDNITIVACVVTESDMPEPSPASEEALGGTEP